MLSASHNPMPDNGIKLFARGGHKLPDDVEDAIEAAHRAEPLDRARPAPASAGSATLDDAARRATSTTCSPPLPHPLDGLASSSTAPTAPRPRSRPRCYRRAGAEVIAIARRAGRPEHQRRRAARPTSRRWPSAVVPSTAPTSASPTTATPTAAWPSTPTATVVDGDQILAILRARACARPGRLDRRHGRRHRDEQPRASPRDARRRHHGWSRPRSATGTCWRRCARGGCPLGGEQSGHVVLPTHATTGDGAAHALHLWPGWPRPGAPLAELAAVVTRLPQVLINVPVADRARRARRRAAVAAAVAAAEAELGDDRPGAAAPVRHRAAGPGDGRGADTAATPAERGRRSRLAADGRAPS